MNYSSGSNNGGESRLLTSSAGLAGIFSLDLAVCRHFETPFASFLWYMLLETAIKV